MPIHTVTKQAQTKAGKPVVYFDNKHDFADGIFLGKTTQMPPMGAQIDANTSSSVFQGKTYWYLNGWALTGQTYQSTVPTQQAPVQQTAYVPLQKKSVELSEPELRFVSNVVGQAITAGTIKSPAGVAPWAAAAYRTLQGLQTGRILDFDDEVPPMTDEGDPGPDDERVPF